MHPISRPVRTNLAYTLEFISSPFEFNIESSIVCRENLILLLPRSFLKVGFYQAIGTQFVSKLKRRLHSLYMFINHLLLAHDWVGLPPRAAAYEDAELQVSI